MTLQNPAGASEMPTPYEHFIVKKIIFSPPAVQRTPDGLPAPARQTGRKLDF